MKVQTFVKEFTKALQENNAAVFAGAGLSSGAGFVNWKELLRGVAGELQLEVEKEHDLIALAQFYCNEHHGRGKLNQIVIDEFQKKAKLTENHKILARLPISTYWTTNYDSLIETALSAIGKIPDVKMEPENLSTTCSGRDAVVYKMHGDISQVHKAVITRDDYEKYELTNRSLFTTALQGDLVNKTFVFIGISFNDPNLNYILSRIRVKLEGNQRPHYCFSKKIVESDYAGKEEFEYAKIKQALQINDLKRFSISTVLIDEYSEITSILQMVENAFRRSNVFISGSAASYGVIANAEEFLHRLSSELVEHDYKVISGFGLGVGSFVINGALEQMEIKKKNRIEENLILRPFPQKHSGKETLAEVWENYRQNMIAEAGIAIFVFGNKMADGKLSEANGVEAEFRIAKEKGLKLIPVGATGFVAQKLWQEIMSNFSDYYPDAANMKPLFAKIGDPSLPEGELIGAIMAIASELRRTV